jgi:HlyD family secretion protein
LFVGGEQNEQSGAVAAPRRIDGIVLTRSIEPGQTVAASFTAPQLFIIAEKLERMKLQVTIAEADIGRVAHGQNASFTVDAWPDRSYTANVSKVSYGSAVKDNVVTYLAELDVANDDLSLRPGMTATATITAQQRTDVLLVPNTALRFTPTVAAKTAKTNLFANMGPRLPGGNRRPASAGASTALARQVWVLPEGDGAVPVAVAVVPGISDGHMTEVTGGDLRVGMRVITDQKVAAK